jgi:hypothetical protein
MVEQECRKAANEDGGRDAKKLDALHGTDLVPENRETLIV